MKQMIKVLGALLIVVACGMFAIKKVQAGRDSMRAEKELQALFLQLSRQISFGLVPIPELIDELCQSRGMQGHAFLEIVKELALDEGCYKTAWEKATEQYQREKGISDEVAEQLHLVGKELGTMDSQTEADRLKLAAKTLEEIIEQEEAEFKKREKTTISIGFLSGAFVVILFL